MRTLLAAHSTELPAAATAPEWVQLLPYGTVSGRDGRGPYTLRDAAHAAQVIAATTAYQRGADLPIDYDHQLLHSRDNGQPAPASGWVRELQARADGLWGRVEWTVAAAARLTGREYRYLSPVFRHRPDGTVTRLVAAALTNLPNLELTALASSSLFSAHDEDDMDLKPLLAALGLPETATFEEAVAHARELAASTAAVAAASQALAPAVGKAAAAKPDEVIAAAAAAITGLATVLKAEPTVEKVAAAAQALTKTAPATTTTAPATTPNPAEWVPMSAFAELQTQVAAMHQGLTEGKAAEAVAQAMAAGKVSPAMKDWATRYAKSDLDGFLAYASQAPVIVTPAKGSGAGPGGATAVKNAHGLDDSQLAICSQMGLDPAAFAKTLTGEETA